MSGGDEFDPFLVYRVEGQSMECALWSLEEGQRALAIFYSRQAAEDFLQAGELGSAWQIFQPARNDLYSIFRRCCANGIRYAVLDPDARQAKRIFDLQQIVESGEGRAGS